MTDRVEAILRDLQGAVAARQLYGPDHPRFTQALARLDTALQAFTRTQGELAVFLFDHHLVFGASPLPGADAVAHGVFGTLAAHGYHRLAFRPGVTADELLRFVTALATAARAGASAEPLRSTPHIHLAALDVSAEAGAAGDLGPPIALGPAAIVDAWHGVAERRQLELDALDVLVLRLLDEVTRPDAPVELETAAVPAAYREAHVTNVSRLAMALASALDLPASVVRLIGLATLLQDVGTLRIPPGLLDARGQLDAFQREQVWRHPVDGARMLLATPGVPELAVVVAFEHHLHVDGGGYPAVPPGWRLNLASAIAHLCDVYDALRSDRPFRPALPRDRVEAIMRADAGTVFDRDLLDVFFSDVIPRTTMGATSSRSAPPVTPN